MGGTVSNMWRTWTRSDVQPDYNNPPTFDPLLGFSEGRKVREMKMTHQEMEEALIPHQYRDYCAHLYVDYMKCRQKNWPWYRACAPEKHNYDNCEYEDWILRMKEYERERRLLLRKKASQGEIIE